MKAQGKGEIRELLGRHGLVPRKALGQHFVGDPNLVDRIVRLAAVGPGDQVVEIGAGTGTLTRALAATGARVVAYEVDERLRPVLDETTAGTGAEVRFADASRADLCADLGAGSWVMVANLPYNVGTGILLDALRSAPCITRFVVMVQLEVAERLVARPGSKTFGLPSVIAGLYGHVSVAARVAPQVFLPPPDVESAIVTISRREAPAGTARAVELAAAGFGQRRKMLRRSLAAAVPRPESLLRRADIEPTLRAEDLTVDDWVRLAAADVER